MIVYMDASILESGPLRVLSGKADGIGGGLKLRVPAREVGSQLQARLSVMTTDAGCRFISGLVVQTEACGP